MPPLETVFSTGRNAPEIGGVAFSWLYKKIRSAEYANVYFFYVGKVLRGRAGGIRGRLVNSHFNSPRGK